MADEARKGGKRNWRAKLLLALGCGVATVALIEGVATVYLGDDFVRGRHVENTWTAVARFDPEFGWSNRPGASERIVFGPRDYTVHVNSAGFRDRERTLAKQAGTQRVLLLGDSVTWGWGVDEDVRFGELLEERLGPDVEVLNLACPGYGTDQQYWTLLERGFAYAPDVVLLVFVLNDVFEARTTHRYGMDKPQLARDSGEWAETNRPVPGPPALKRTLRRAGRELVARSALLAWATGRGHPAELEKVAKKPYPRPNAKALAPVREAGDSIADPAGVTYHLLGLLRAACAERGVSLLTTLVPHKHDQYTYEPDFPRPDDLTEDGFRTHATRALERAAAALDIQVVTVDEALLRVAGTGERLHVGDGHLNAAGHVVVADVLEPALRAALAAR